MTYETTPQSYQSVDLETWPRRGHFEFFSSFEEPYFSITAQVECQGVVRRCREQGRSVTFDLWHGILVAANAVEEFRYRISDDRPVLFDKIHLSPTILRPDKTFTISFAPYIEDLASFTEVAKMVVAEAKNTQGFELNTEARRIDLVHFSTVPWFRFTGLSHARPFGRKESEPKVTIGRFEEDNSKFLIPVSVTGHHGLMDGIHVAEFLQNLQELWA